MKLFLLKLPSYLISITISPILILVILIFFIYQKLIEFYLVLKHGENFGGFLLGKDARMSIEDLSKCTVNCLFIVDFSTTDSKMIYDLFLDQLAKVFEADNDPKLSCSVIRKYGYCYLIKNQVSPSNVVSTFTDAKNNKLIPMEKVQEFLSQVSCEKMPKNNTAMIEFIISDKPIKYEESKTTFAVICRIPHCIMDEPALVHFLFHNILSGPIPKQFTTAQTPQNFNQDLKSTILNFFTGSYDFLMVDTLKKREWNCFHRGALSQQRLLHWISEKEFKMIPRIQEIKRRTGASITNILAVAVATSLKQFAKTRNKKLERLTMVTTIQTQPVNFFKSPKLTNTFAVNIFSFPLNSLTFTKTIAGNLSKFLEDYLQCFEAFQCSNLTTIIDSFVRILGKVAPLPIQNIFRAKNITFLLTNMGNLNSAKFWTFDLKNVAFFSHNEGQLGLSFVALTYRDKLNICLTADQRYLHHTEEADGILEAIYRNLNQLLRELLLKK